MYEWNWAILSTYYSVFLRGALVTLTLTGVVICTGSLLGVVFALLRRSDNLVVVWLVRLYIQLFRALPTLVLLIWIFYVMPLFINIRLSPFVSAAVALSLHLAAFVAETVRAGFESIAKGQYESGLALGMSSRQVMVRIMAPQATKNILPNLIGLYITELKNSSLTSVIAVDELLHRANILISETFRPLEIYTAVAVMYLILIVPLIYLAHLAERQLSKGQDRKHIIINATGNQS
jgi:polar amino acid transport system permease protein